MRSALCRVQPARCRRAYHNDTTLVRVAERFDISQPADWYRLNRAAVLKEFPDDKEVRRVFKEHISLVLESRSPENEWFPWLFKQGVPRGFWEDSDNHGRYATWLAAELLLVGPEAWYELTKEVMCQNGGTGLVNNHYNGSALQFVEQVVKVHLHPDHEWIPWVFKHGVPRGYWYDSANRGRYAEWLAAELQLVEPEDWYQLTGKMIYQNGGAGLLNGYYNDSPQQFVEQVVKMHLHPEHQWFPWLFDGSVPRGFWDDSANHVWYAAWLAVELQLVDPEDWYQLTQKMVHRNSGRGLLSGYYNDSPQQFVEEVVKVHLHPDREWIREWNHSRGKSSS